VFGGGKISVGQHERAPARLAVVLAAMSCDHHHKLTSLGRGKPSGKPGKGRTRRKWFMLYACWTKLVVFALISECTTVMDLKQSSTITWD